MPEVYRKQGTVVRWEHGLIVRVEEAGEATEDGDVFRCHPIPPYASRLSVNSAALEVVVSEIQDVVMGGVRIERLLVSEGVARQEVGGRGWDEVSRRIHVSLINPVRRLRAMLDLAAFNAGVISSVARALSVTEVDRHPGSRLRLAPNVTAALLPSMVRQGRSEVRLFQTSGGLDGRGLEIEECELTAAPWPNWYRPSYRVRPVRAPLNIRAQCARTDIDGDVPEAIALLAPPAGGELKVLIADNSAVFTATVCIRTVLAGGPPEEWFPYGAGSWGARMEVELE